MDKKIYHPSEDSYLLKKTLEDYLSNLLKNNKIKSNNRSFYNHKQTQHIINVNNIGNDIKSIKILDMGSGSGIQAQTCRKLGFKNILSADINPEAVKNLKQQGFNAIKSNLFSNINKKDKLNLIIFNPPYLPEDKYDKKQDTTAGKQGYELIIKFLKQAKEHLEKDASIILLFSSLSKPDIIIKQAKQLKYKIKLLNKQKLFFEELYVYKLK